MTINERNTTPEPESAYHYRITWVEGKPHLQRCKRGRNWLWSSHGEIVRPATEEDMRRMYAGEGIAHDPATDPSTKAWEAHVAAGGD